MAKQIIIIINLYNYLNKLPLLTDINNSIDIVNFNPTTDYNFSSPCKLGKYIIKVLKITCYA